MTWSVPGFTAERRLGHGATGEVWSGRDAATGERVALKRLRPGAGELDAERLRREAALLAAFRHPHVIGLRGVLGTEQGIVLVLELAAGGSLAGLLSRRERLRSGQTVALLAPIAEALAAAHAAGLLHGDVSPGNVLLDGDGRPLLADLGTARLAGDRSLPVHGTSGFVDPAVRAGATPTSASDVYSLAAVAARALTGRELTTAADAAPQWADRALTIGVPSALVLAVCEALTDDPVRRPGAAELAARLRSSVPAESLVSLVPQAEVLTDPAESRVTGAGFAGSVVTGPGVLAGPGPGPAPGSGPDDFTRRVPRPERAAVPVAKRRWWQRARAAWPPEARDAWPPEARPASSRPAWLSSEQPGRSVPGRRSGRLPGTPRPARRPGAELIRRSAVGAAVLALVCVAAIAWVAGGRSSQPQPGAGSAGERVAAVPVTRVPSPTASPPTAAPAGSAPAGTPAVGDAAASAEVPTSAGEWAAVLAALDVRRAAAFARADARLLASVYAPGSLPLAVDERSIRTLRAAGATAVGVRHEIRRVRTPVAAAARFRLEFTDRMPAYRIVDARGATLRTVPARAEQAFTAELVRVATGWRIVTLERAAAPAGSG